MVAAGVVAVRTVDEVVRVGGAPLEALAFEITTRSQQSVSRLGFWLSTSFGAIETGFAAARVANWYYANNLGAVLGWTIYATLCHGAGHRALAALEIEAVTLRGAAR